MDRSGCVVYIHTHTPTACLQAGDTHIPNSTQSQIDPKTPILPQPGLMPRRQRLRPLLLLPLLQPPWMAAAPAPAPLAVPAAAGHDRPLAGGVGTGVVAVAPRHDGFGLGHTNVGHDHPILLPVSLVVDLGEIGRYTESNQSKAVKPLHNGSRRLRLAMAPLQASSLRRPHVPPPRLQALI